MSPQQMAGVRALFGVLPLLAPSRSARVLGFSEQDDRPATRLFARLFGVRELLLAALVLRAGDDEQELPRIAMLQACVDAGDAASLLVPLARRQGLGRPAALMLVPALAAVPLWLRHARQPPR